MRILGNPRSITGLVLVWFVLSLGSTITSTILDIGGLQLICTAGGGTKLVDTRSDEGEKALSAEMACPLCASAAAPPPSIAARFDKPSALAHALQPIAAAYIASATAPPLPSRGPPPALV